MTLVQKEIKRITIRPNGVEKQIRPVGWKVDCVWWYKLESDANDYSWNNNNATWSWTASYSTVWWKLSANFDTSRYLTTPINVGTWPITIACLFYKTWTSWYQTVIAAPYSWNGAPVIWMCYYTSKFYIWAWNTSIDPYTYSAAVNTRHFCAIRIDSNWNIKVNLDNNTVTTHTTTSFNINSSIYIGAWAGNKFTWNIKQVAIWNKSISDDELEEYKTAIMW